MTLPVTVYPSVADQRQPAGRDRARPRQRRRWPRAECHLAAARGPELDRAERSRRCATAPRERRRRNGRRGFEAPVTTLKTGRRPVDMTVDGLLEDLRRGDVDRGRARRRRPGDRERASTRRSGIEPAAAAAPDRVRQRTGPGGVRQRGGQLPRRRPHQPRPTRLRAAQRLVSMSAPEQAFVLSNLDRIQYGLAPIPGLTAALSQDASGGVQSTTTRARAIRTCSSGRPTGREGSPTCRSLTARGCTTTASAAGTSTARPPRAAVGPPAGHPLAVRQRRIAGDGRGGRNRPPGRCRVRDAARGRRQLFQAGLHLYLVAGARRRSRRTWRESAGSAGPDERAADEGSDKQRSHPHDLEPTRQRPPCRGEDRGRARRRVQLLAHSPCGPPLGARPLRPVRRRRPTRVCAPAAHLRVRATGALATRYLTIP